MASGYPVPAIAGALTDLGEIDKFVKEHAEAIPLGEAAVLYSVSKSRRRLLLTARLKCGLPVCAALATRKKTDGR